MPYINPKDRGQYNGHIKDLANMLNNVDKTVMVGHLNYIISKLCLMTNPKMYSDYNSLMGVLECAKLELYRRKIAVYEEEKIVENGDVY